MDLFRPPAGPPVGLPIVLLALVALTPAAPALTLAEAEALALAGDPGVAALERRGEATLDRAVAAAVLPEPQLEVGARALPVDTLDLDQEPMTRLALGLVQRFPRGRTLDFRRARLEAEGERQLALARDTRADVLLALRQAWIDRLLQHRLLAVVDTTEAVLDELRALAEDYYATGRARQQDLQEAALELARLAERRLSLRQAEAAATARLTTWVGARAEAIEAESWPAFPEAKVPEEHPRIAAAERAIGAAQAAIGVAQEQYKPGFSVAVSYGNRSGQEVDGRERPDVVSAMVRVDLPVFRSRRQDRVLAAARLDAEAARLVRDDTRRRLAAAREENRRALALARERLALLTGEVLAHARENSVVALAAYRAAVGPLEALLRARLAELEVRMDVERTRAEIARLEAERAWLAGASS